jgi:tRNA A22 N-methylase
MDVIEDSDVETMDIGENHVYYKRYVVQDNVKDIVKDKYLSCSDMNGEIFVVSIENYYDIGADHFETTQELLKEAWSGVSRADG